jgi:hypothetical protein
MYFLLFFDNLLYDSVSVAVTQHQWYDWRRNKKEGIWKKAAMVWSREYHKNLLEGITKTKKSLVRIVGIPAEFQKEALTEHKHRAHYTPHIAPSATSIVSSIILSRYQKFEQSVLYEQCYILIELEGRTVSSVNVSNASDLFPRGPIGHCSYILVYKFQQLVRGRD